MQIENLLDILFIKRFCLPINTDLSLYKTGMNKIKSCLCSNFNHASVILHKKSILCFGYNKSEGYHAEYDAINKLVINKKRLKSINILVVRFNGSNKIQSSKPCYNCINTIKNEPCKKGYKIKYVYYSNEDESIIKSNIKELDSVHISRGFRRK